MLMFDLEWARRLWYVPLTRYWPYWPFDLSKLFQRVFFLQSLALKFTPISKGTSRNKITVISFGSPSFSFLIFSSFSSFSRLTRSRSFSTHAGSFVLIKVMSCLSTQNFPSKTSQCNTLTHSLTLHHIYDGHSTVTSSRCKWPSWPRSSSVTLRAGPLSPLFCLTTKLSPTRTAGERALVVALYHRF